MDDLRNLHLQGEHKGHKFYPMWIHIIAFPALTHASFLHHLDPI